MTAWHNHNDKESGNILFLILLAVVLFAALSYAVTSSTRGGEGKSAKSESVQAQVAAMLGFFSQMDTALMRMQITGGLKPENISLEYRAKIYDGTVSTSHVNSNCNSDTCRLFKVDGGGVSPVTFEAYAVPEPTSYAAGWPMPGHYDFVMVQWPQAGTDLNDVVMRVNGMPRAVCTEVNRQMGLTGTPSVSGTYVGAQGTSNWDVAAYTVSVNASQLAGSKHTFGGGASYSGTPGEYCIVFHLLIAR